MNTRTIIFIGSLLFIVGIVIGYSIHKPTVIERPAVSTITIKDTIVKVENDTIKIPQKQIKYFTKIDTIIQKDTIISSKIDCMTFPLFLSDSSIIEITECSNFDIPKDLRINAKYLDKREKIRVIEKIIVDTVKLKPKRLGFTLGPSAGIGIDINDISRPSYFIGVTLTYGLRF